MQGAWAFTAPCRAPSLTRLRRVCKLCAIDAATASQVYKEATFPRPRNVVGMLKKLPDSEMEKLLLSNVIVGENELQELAKQRAMSARDALTTNNEELKARIFLKKTDIYQPPKKPGSQGRVEFGMGAN